jgi:Ca-activated chloride channel family protein
MQGRFIFPLAIALLALALLTPVGAVAQKSSDRNQERSPTISTAPSSAKQNLPQTTKPEGSEADVIRVETDLVNTLFTAVDKDRHFITSLRSEDIRIFEDGVQQDISLFEHEVDRQLSIAILIDTSESQKVVLSDEKGAARAFVDSVIRPTKDRAAILSFTGVTRVEQGLTNELAKLRAAIGRVKVSLSPENERRLQADEPPLPADQDPTGYTGVWDAIWATVEKLLSSTPEQTRRAIILLSDGDDTSSKVKRQEAIDVAVKSDVVVYSIGIRDRDFPEGKLDRGSLRKVSEHTGGRAFFPTDDSGLQLAFSQIEQELRSQYAIAYSPKNKARDGAYHQVKIELVNPELRKRKLQLLYRQGYYAKKQ